MKIDKVPEIGIVPPSTYTISLTIEELYALRGLLGAEPNQAAIAAYTGLQTRCYVATDGPRSVGRLKAIANTLWYATNKYLNDIRAYLKTNPQQ